MSIVILCGIYLAELACYQLGIRILFEARQKTKLWMMIGILFPVVIGCLSVDVTGKNILVSASVISLMFVSIEGSISEKGVKLMLTLLMMECIDDFFTYPCGLILEYYSHRYVDNLEYLASKCCTVMGLFLLNIIRFKFDQKRKERINSEIYYIIGITAASMMFCMTLLNHVKQYLKMSRYIMLCDILNIIIHISIILLVVFVIYIKNTHERMEQLLKTEKLLKESQVNYYKQALKKETDTRKYRHDMISHLGYIRDCLSEDKIDEAKNYLISILGGFNKILNAYYVTGNDMIDTIMNHMFELLPEDAKVIIENRTPVEFDIEDTELCTIFSNIFQNAVEEIVENDIKEAEIFIIINKGKEYAEYNIKNSLSKEVNKECIDKNGLLKSHKLDQRNHGIGMLNVKEAVERNCGHYEWYQNNGYFCVNIILPLKR